MCKPVRFLALGLGLLLLFLLLSTPVLAFVGRGETPPEPSPVDDLPVAAWLDGDTLYVAIGNDSTERRNVTIEYEVVPEGFRRPLWDRRTVVVPGRSVLLESFAWKEYAERDRFAAPPKEVTIDTRYETFRVPVQDQDLVYPHQYNYVLESNRHVAIHVNLASLVSRSQFVSLIVDDAFSISGTRVTGDVRITSVGGGYTEVPRRPNVVEYRPPQMELSVRVPRMRGMGILHFNMTQVFEDYRSTFRETISSPYILVYGTDIRFIDNTRSSREVK